MRTPNASAALVEPSTDPNLRARRIVPAALVLCAVLLAAAASAAMRIGVAFATGWFDGSPDGLLRADPGTLWYLLQRVIADGGWPGPEFSADPRVEHPHLVDCWARFTIGHELLLAQAHFALPHVPLHRLCIIVMSIVASLATLGVYGLAREVSGSRTAAVLAAWLYAATPAAYRTLGLVLMNEDLSLTLFAAHLWLAARALRRRTPGAAALAGLAAAAAAATWHATTFLLAATWACAGLAQAWTGRALLPVRAAAAFVGTAALASLAVPALRAKAFVVGLPVQLAAAAMLAGALTAGRGRLARLAAFAAAAACFAMLGRGAAPLLGADPRDFAHVFELMLAKVRHLGRFPDDPSRLSFDARIMWQGPFASLPASTLLDLLGAALFAAVAGVVAAPRRAPDDHPGRPILALLLAAGIVGALAVARLQVFPALVVPVAAASFFVRLAARARRAAVVVAVLVLGLQAAAQWRFCALNDLSYWYDPGQIAEVRSALEAIRDLTPPDAAIAADPVNGGAILAHTGRRIAVQAKWETASSRAPMRALLNAFHLGTTDDVYRVVREELRCDWFLVDRRVLWGVCRQMSGIPLDQVLPRPGTAAAAFCSDDFGVLTSIPGFELVYRSPSWLQSELGPTDFVRLYRLRPK